MYQELRDIARDTVKQLLVWPYVCVVFTWQVVYLLLRFAYIVFRGMLVLGFLPFQVVYYIAKELWLLFIFRPVLTDAQLHELIDMMRTGPPLRSDADLLWMMSDAQTKAPRWPLRNDARGCTRDELVRLVAILKVQMCQSTRLSRFFPVHPSLRKLPPRPLSPSPPLRPSSPPSNPGMSYPNARSGSPQRSYPYQTEPASRKNQWMGTISYKPTKKGKRRIDYDLSNRDERVQAAQERRKASLAAKAKKKMAEDARKAEMERNLAIGRRINSQQWTPRNKGKRAVVPSSLTGVPENEPHVSTLKDWSPITEVDASRDDDAQSVKTENIPLPQTFHGEKQRVQRRYMSYQVQRTLKHGSVAPGHRAGTYVHRPTVEGDPVVVTAKSGSDFVIVTNI